MRGFFITAFMCALVFASTSGVSAQSRAASAEATIERAERAWAAALVSKDLDQLTSILDARFRLVSVSSSPTVEYSAYLSQQAEPQRAYRSMTPTSVSVAVSGRIAVATVNMTVAWPQNFDGHSTWRFTDTWMYDRGEWRVVMRASEPVDLT